MADISKEIQDFQEAVYGEEVRGSMISLAEKINGEVEDNTEKVTQYGEAEASRAQAEAARVNAEKARVTAESGRVSAEESRVTAENTRAQNEEDRISAEEDRAEAESARANAESARVSAESGRATAESGRASAESARVTAESGRDTAESGRATAEQNRVSAETARANAESARETAEATRQTNTEQAIDDCDEATERANTAAQAAEDMVAGKGLVMSTEKGVANGVATLDGNAKIPQNQIDGSNIPITFEQAAQRANIQSGDTMAEALAKLSKLYADLKPYVFSNPANNLTETDASIPLAAPQGKALSDRIGSLSSLTTSVKTSIVNAINSLKSVVDGKLSTSNVVNNLTTTASGKALDARQGKALNDKYTALNSALTSYTTGKATTNTAYLTSSSECYWVKCGKVCSVHAYMKIAKTITDGAVYFSGLPRAYNTSTGQQFHIPSDDGHGNVQVYEDDIKEWYGDKPAIGTEIKFGFTYICE